MNALYRGGRLAEALGEWKVLKDKEDKAVASFAAPGANRICVVKLKLAHRCKPSNVSLTPHESCVPHVFPGAFTGFSPRYQSFLDGFLRMFPHTVLKEGIVTKKAPVKANIFQV